MRGIGWVGRHRLQVSSVVVVALALVATTLYALASRGNPARHARLNDAGVWVSTDRTTGATGTAAMFGEMDVPAAQFAATLTPADATTGLDVLQLGEAVAGFDAHTGSLTPIDPKAKKLNSGDVVKLGNATPSIGGNASSGTLAVLDPAKGTLWVTPIDATVPVGNLSSVDPSTAKPTAKVGSGAHVAVGVDGVVHAVSAGAGLTSIAPKATGAGWTVSTTKLPDVLRGTLQVSSVGGQVVALALADGSDTPQLLLPNGHTVSLDHRAPGGAVELQQPGPAAADVLVGTGNALLAVSLRDGAVRVLVQGTGTPATPVLFQSCQFAAWSGPSASEARVCGSDIRSKPLQSDSGPAVSDLVYRQNHEQLLLNDRTSGQVWQDQSGNPTQIADWLAVQRPRQNKKPKDQPLTSTQDHAKAPKAKDDALGARPGRVTVLHVLDNDSTPRGTVLTVNSVESPTTADATVAIAPDRQSVLVDLQPVAAGTFTFHYDASNGSANPSNKATVTVTVRPDGTYFGPALRDGYLEPAWSVPVNGVLTVPVLNDWRVNPDGDPPALGALGPDSVGQPGASAIATADGSLVYRAGKNPGNDTIKYTVVDGDKVTPASVSITIQARSAKAVPPVAENDYVRTAVGQPLTIHPLANDLPGSDPLSPDANLKIAGVIKGRPGLQVSPPTADGAVTITATAPGSYPLTYQDSYGSVNSDTSVIRVDAVQPDPHAQVSAAPVSVTVRGQIPALVDPLAGDSSPYGGLLTVVGVHVRQNSNLEVAVVRSSYLRVNARQSSAKPGDQTSVSETFDYVVTDGHSTATAQVTVIEMPPLANDVPVAETAYADVRAGDSVAVPVLDGAVDPAGDTLSLVQDIPGAPTPGQLIVTGTTTGQQVGQAFVSGSEVRYLAPPASPGMTQQQQVSVSYQVVNGSGGTDTGTAVITVHPPGTVQTDQAPVPHELTARVVAGSTVTIPVPTSEVDPDGDTVQVQGLGLPDSGDPQPKLGAVTAFSANSLTYQAYPSATNAGTDTFTYVVADSYGLTARATVRVAVVQPTVLPAPVAHSFTVTAAPGTRLALNVVSPAHVDYPDGAPPTLLDPNKALSEGKSIATLDKRPGWLDLAVPQSSPTGTVSVNYQVVADLGAPSTATITVQIKPGYVIPPVAVDEFAKPKPKATSVELSLLAGDYSPTGGTLSVVGQANVQDGKLTATLTGRPQIVPFVVKDSHGGTAEAVAYVPASGTNALPYWNGRTIQIPAGSATPVDISRYVIDPQGASDQLTDRTKVWTSPSPGLTGAITGRTTVQLTGAAGYQGPASVTFAVTRTGDLNTFTLVTIPVVVGQPTPVLRCPTDVVQVQEGLVDGSAISPLSQCHVWTPPSVDPASLRFHLVWKRPADKVSITRNDAAKLTIFADHDARPRTSGVLTVTVDGYGSKGSDLNILVIPAPLITVAPISVQGILTTGQPTTINLRSYVDSPFGFDKVSIVSVGSVGNVQVSHTTGTITASTSKRDLSGRFQLSYTVTDLSNQQDRSRWKSGTIALQFIGVPGKPSAVTPRPGYLSEQVPVTWVAPPNNGAAIDKYEVDYTSDTAGSGTQTCSASGCSITKLHNGANYRFSVKAHNIAGWGDLGTGGATGTPDVIPGVVTGFRVQYPPGDKALVLTWNPVNDKSSADSFSYTITWSGGVSGSHVITDRAASTYTVTGLNNDTVESFTIFAANRAGAQPTAAPASGQSAGKPAAPAFESGTFVPTKTADGKAAVIIKWQAVDSNGAGPVTYTLVKDGTSQICATQSLQCDDTLDANGSSHTYTVTAANKWNTGPTSAPAHVDASVQPNQMPAPSIDPVQASDPDGQVTVHFTTAASGGGQLTVHCSYTTDGSAPSEGSATCPGSPWSGYSIGGGESGTKTLAGLSSSNSVAVRVAMWETNGSTNGSQNSTGDISNPSNAVNTNAPPTAPQNLQCTSQRTATLAWAWSASSGTNGRSVQYRVVYDGGDAGTTGGTSYSRGAADDGQYHNLQVFAVDSHNDQSSGSNIAGCQDPGPPQFQVQHYGTCTHAAGCENVEVRLVGFLPGGSASCYAGGVQAPDWGPYTLTAGSDGTSGWVNKGLWDSPSNRFTDGTFALGQDAGGVTCR